MYFEDKLVEVTLSSEEKYTVGSLLEEFVKEMSTIYQAILSL